MKTNFMLSSIIMFFFLSTIDAQVVLERDINQEAASSDPYYHALLDNVLYFGADDGINGEELYRYDISTQTATIVANLRPYDDGSSIENIISFDDKIFFNAKSISGFSDYLFVHDPSDNSTQRLMDSDNQDLREPSNFTIFDDHLFFTAELSGTSTFLKYNPNTNQLENLVDANIYPNGIGTPNFFNQLDGKLWFTSSDGESNSQLWRYDPLTNEIENIVYNSPNELYPSISFLYLFDGKFFFRGYIQGRGSEIWGYDPSSNTLLEIPELYPGPASSSPSGFIAYDGKLYFIARTLANGRELRVYDPITEEIELLVDIAAGNANSSPGTIILLNDKLYFTANNGDNEARNLYSYNPSNGNLTTEGSIDYLNGQANYLSIASLANDRIFLTGRRLDTGTELYQFTPGDSEISIAADINKTTIGSRPYQFTPYNGKLFFGADEINSGREVWVYKPETGNVELVTDSPISTSPNGFTVLDGKLFFSGVDPDVGYGLLYYDDATGLSSPTSYITPNSSGHITDITVYNDKLYFKAKDDIVGTELFVYDPSDDSYQIAADIHPTDNGRPEKLFVHENELYFQANDGTTGTELWKYNDNTEEATLVADINEGEEDSYPESFQSYNGELYFSAYKPETSYELYSYNSTTNTLTQRSNETGNLDPTYLTIYRDKLFFRASRPDGSGLVYYDDSTDEIVSIDSDDSGMKGPRDLVVFNDKLYFSGSSDAYGNELWEYNDTSLAIVADIRSGVPDSEPSSLTLFNDKLYFSANDGIKGKEIWSIAECLNIYVDTEAQVGMDGVGSIDLTIEGGLPPYTIEWNTGDTTEDIDNLQPGFYTATIADASGCLSEITAEVSFVSSTENIIPEDQVGLFPNPNEGTFTLDVGHLKVTTIAIFDLKGQLLYQKILKVNEALIPIHLRYATPGIYIAKISTPNGIAQKKLVIK